MRTNASSIVLCEKVSIFTETPVTRDQVLTDLTAVPVGHSTLIVVCTQSSRDTLFLLIF